VHVEPPYRLHNFLPKPLLAQMLSHTKIKSLSNKIGLKETWEVFDYSQSRNTFIKISLPSFFWSRDALLYDTNQTL
jgi:hypothetical protein